jgi:hypothetical protein
VGEKIAGLVARESDEQQRGAFEERFEGGEELRADGAVDDAVVAGERERHRLADDDLAGFHDGLRDGRADGEDRGVGRVDDGAEFRDAHHAEIGNAEGAAGELGGRELSSPWRACRAIWPRC